MTLLEIETILSDRGLRLKKVIRPPRSRRWIVTVMDETAGKNYDATGLDLEEAVKNAVAAAMRRPKRNGKRRYVS